MISFKSEGLPSSNQSNNLKLNCSNYNFDKKGKGLFSKKILVDFNGLSTAIKYQFSISVFSFVQQY
jgi:hypothetical protein